jgi:hypothetical protein
MSTTNENQASSTQQTTSTTKKETKRKKRNKKRKLSQMSASSTQANGSNVKSAEGAQPQQPSEETAKHPKKKRKHSKPRKEKPKETLSLNWQEIRFDNVDAQLTHFWALYVETLGQKLTALELEDKLPSAEKCFVRPKPPKWDLTYLPTFILEILPEMKDFRRSATDTKNAEDKKSVPDEAKQNSAPTLPKGQPLLLILTSAAARAIEIAKAVKEFSVAEAPVAHLFSKHKKIEEQRAFLQKRPINIAIGTPNRIDKLLKLEDTLSLQRTKYVLIDCFANAKGFTIFDIKETRLDLFNLYHDHLHKRVQGGQIKLVLF